jgi:hypothetical protein
MKWPRLPPLNVAPDAAQAWTQAASPPKRRSMFVTVFRGVGWLGSSPVHWMGIKSIRGGASFIGDMAALVRACPAHDPRFKTAEEGRFDLRATAFSLGMTVAELQRRLAARRRQTALTAYALGALGAALFVSWGFKVVATPVLAGRLLLAFDFLPLCFLFVLLAFYQALVNFQIRLGRAAGWREYLTTENGFWPRL